MKNKMIVVKNKTTKEEIFIDANHFYNDFQIGFEAGKLVSKYPEEEYIIFLQKNKI